MANDIELRIGSQDNTGADFDALKVKLDDLAKQRAAISIDVDDKDAQAKIDLIDTQMSILAQKSVSPKLTLTGDAAIQAKIISLTAQLDVLGKKDEKPNVDVTGVDGALAKTAALDAAMDELGKSGNDAGNQFAALGEKLAPLSGAAMPALIGSAVALSPVLVTVGSSLGLFAAAGYATVKPIEAAATATGGLKANLGTLDTGQRQVATSLLSLESQFGKFSKSVQPQVISALNTTLHLTSGVLTALAPAARSAGSALDGVLQDVAADFRSGEWQQFFGWMQANAGPDIQQLGQLFIDTANDIPPLLEELQPLAQSLLTVTDSAALLAGGFQKLDVVGLSSETNALSSSTSGWGKLTDLLKVAADTVVPGTSTAIDKLTSSTSSNTSATAKAAQQQQKTTSAVQGMAGSFDDAGGKALSLAGQITAVTNALDGLNNKTNTGINDAVAFTNAQDTLTTALKASNDRVGLQTTASRNSASAMTAAASAAQQNSDAILKTTGSASKAIGPLQSLVGQLQASGAKGQFAASEISTLEAEIATLKSKEVTINVALTGSGAAYFGSVANQGGGGSSYMVTASGVLGRATGGVVGAAAVGGPRSGMLLVGEHGPELVSLPTGSTVRSNSDSSSMIGGGQNITVTLDFGQNFQRVTGLTQQQLADLRYSVRTMGGGNVQRAFGNGTS